MSCSSQCLIQSCSQAIIMNAMTIELLEKKIKDAYANTINYWQANIIPMKTRSKASITYTKTVWCLFAMSFNILQSIRPPVVPHNLERIRRKNWWLYTWWSWDRDLPPALGFSEALLSSNVYFSLTHSHRKQRKLKLNNCLVQGHFLLKCLEYFSLPHSQFFNIIRESNHYKPTAQRLQWVKQKSSVLSALALTHWIDNGFVVTHRLWLWSVYYTKYVALPCLTIYRNNTSQPAQLQWTLKQSSSGASFTLQFLFYRPAL